MDKSPQNCMRAFLFNDSIMYTLSTTKVCLYHVYVTFFFTASLFSQTPVDSLQTITLAEVKLVSSQFNVAKNTYPAATTVLNISPFEEKEAQLSLQNTLLKAGGVLSTNASNFAQDLRISIRGFGARSAFGIRGVKIMVDGVPETTPDGQGQLDNLPLGLLNRVEIIKGPNATAYGNAAGGVIHLQTLDRVNENFTHINLLQGQYGQRNLQFTLGQLLQKTEMVVHAQHQKWNGYRSHSAFENTLFNTSVLYPLKEKHTLKFRFNATFSPYAYDAGGQTLNEFENTPDRARERNAEYNAHEKVTHIKSSLAYTGEWKKLFWSQYAYLATRDFEALLPFQNGGWVNLDRNYAGLGGHLQTNFALQEWQIQALVGYAIDRQEDERTRYQNLTGERGDQSLKQLEAFSSASIYLRGIAQLSRWKIHAGLRFDRNNLRLSDRFLTNGNQSDQQNLPAINPQLGLRYVFSTDRSLFAQISQSFETPTLSELSADPQGNGGFNGELGIQKATNIELGWNQKWKKHQYSLTLFSIRTKDDLVPYELDAFPGRTFYTNAGSTLRQGIELESKWTVNPQWSLIFNYNYAHYTYRDYQSNGIRLDGNYLPGIPQHQGFLSSQFAWGKDWNLETNIYYRGQLFAEDANAVSVDSAEVIHLYLSKKVSWLGLKLLPTLGIQNVLNDRYSDNVRINAFGGRYYEAAPLRNAYLSLRFTF